MLVEVEMVVVEVLSGNVLIKGLCNGIYYVFGSRYYNRIMNLVVWFFIVEEVEVVGYWVFK